MEDTNRPKRPADDEIGEASKKILTENATSEGNETHQVAESAQAADAAKETASSSGKMTLYHADYACSTRVLFLINELGLNDKFEVVKKSMAEAKSEEYLKVNPHGAFPALVLTDGSVMLESGAIFLWILEHFGASSALAVPESQRSKLYQWTFYATASLYPAMCAGFSKDKPFDQQKENIQKKLLPYIDSQLGDNSFLLGPNFSAADVAIAYELWGIQHLKWTDDFPRLNAYLERICSRPAWKASVPVETPQSAIDAASAPTDAPAADAAPVTAEATSAEETQA